jgi:hypothetical protein
MVSRAGRQVCLWVGGLRQLPRVTNSRSFGSTRALAVPRFSARLREVHLVGLVAGCGSKGYVTERCSWETDAQHRYWPASEEGIAERGERVLPRWQHPLHCPDAHNQVRVERLGTVLKRSAWSARAPRVDSTALQTDRAKDAGRR